MTVSEHQVHINDAGVHGVLNANGLPSVNGFLCNSIYGVYVTRERMNLPQCQSHPVHDLCSHGVGHAAPVTKLAMTINCPVQQTPGHRLPSLPS